MSAMRRVSRFAVLFALAAGWWTPSLGQTIPALPAPGNATALLSAVPAPVGTKGQFSVAVAGDLIISAPMAREPLRGLERTWKVLRDADIAFANMETPPVDPRATYTFPNGDALLRGPPELAADARAMGFRMMSLANNHATDLGPEAVLNTRQLFKAAGVAVAGSGATLEDARAPAYLDTPKGRVALIATASTFKPNSMAQDAMPAWPPRAGLNVIHVQKISVVTPSEMEALKVIARRQSYGRYRPPAADATEIVLNDSTYRVGSKPGVTWEMNEYDRYAVLKAIHDARQRADLVIFSIHAHESDTGIDDDNPVPADFLPQLFHQAVQAGADVVVGGGPHANRGIEVYRGKPIFYGMGLFTMSGKAYFSQEAEMSGVVTMPGSDKDRAKLGAPIGNPRSWMESMVAVVDFADGKFADIRIYPVDLGGQQPPPRRGRPIIAEGPRASAILTLLQRDSTQFGTTIERRGAIGVIDGGSDRAVRR